MTVRKTKSTIAVMIVMAAMLFCSASIAYAKDSTSITANEGEHYKQTIRYDKSKKVKKQDTAKQIRVASKTSTIKTTSKKINGKNYSFTLKKSMNGFSSKETVLAQNFDSYSSVIKSGDKIAKGTVVCSSPKINGYKLDSVKTKHKKSDSSSTKSSSFKSKEIIKASYFTEKYSVKSPSISVKNSGNSVVVTYSFQLVHDSVTEKKTRSNSLATKKTMKTVDKYTQVHTYKKQS